MTTASDHEPPQSLTPTDIISLAQQNQLHLHILSETSHKTLISHLKTLTSSSTLLSQYTISLLTLISLSPHTPSFSSLLSSLLSTYTNLFLSSQIPPDHDSLRTFQFFNSLLGFVPVPDVCTVLDSILCNLGGFASLEDTQVMDLVPGCLGLVFREDGREKVNLVLDRVLESDWSKGLLIKLVSLAWEFSGFFDKDRRREFLEKVFDGIGKVLDLQDLPSVVYQLLVLGSKGFDKRGIIEGIVRFFGSDDELFGKGRKRAGSSVVRQVEGTVLLHVNFAVKQDPSLAQEVLGLVKLDLGAFNHFTFTVLLSVASVNRFKEKAMAVLKNAVITAYGDCNAAKDCKWLLDDLKNEYLKTVQAVEKAVLRAVTESHYGREHILPTIVQFGFVLLESSLEGKKGELCSSSGLLSVEELGIQILKTLFEVHDMARTEIIDHCKFHIISQKPEQSLKIIRLLGCLIKCYPHAMQEHVSRFKELLDYFAFMHGKVASYLVDSVVPLARFSYDLRDYMILVVRKAMFRQEDSVRLAATSSILDLIVAEKPTRRDGSLTVQDSSSQASCSQQAEVPCVTSKGLFQELSGLLQRCLYQQAKVKEIVYYGLVKLVLADPASGGAVLDFLLPHFIGIFDENTDIQHQINQCIKQESGRVVIAEPLDCLLSCVSWILLLQPHREDDRPDSSWPCFGFSLSQETEAGGNKSRESFSKVFSKTRQLLRKGKLEGILNQAVDAGSTSLGEEKRRCCAFLLLGIVEVFLNLISAELEQATDARKLNLENEVLAFIDLYESLHKDTCAKQGSGTKRGNSRTGAVDLRAGTGPSNGKLTKERTFFLTTSSVLQLVQTALKLYDIEVSKTFSHSQNRSQLSSAKPVGIISFAMNAILRHLKSYSTWGKEDTLKAFIWDIKLIGPPLIKFMLLFNPVLKLTADEMKTEKIGRKEFDERMEHLHLALLCLKELMKTSLQSPQLTGVLNNLLSSLTVGSAEITEDAEDARIDDDQHANKQLFIANFLKPMFTDLLAHSRFRKIEIVGDIIIMLGEKLPEKWRNQNGAFSILVCKTHATTDSKIAKTVVALSFHLSSPPDDLILAEDMAKELLKFMLPETKQTVEVSELFAIMNKSTSSMICSCILQHIEAVIADMDWAVKKLKAFSLVAQRASHLSQKEECVSVLAFEDNLYLRAEAVVKALSSFFSMTLKDAQAEHLLRFTAKFYKQLAQMAKFRIAPKGCKQPLPSLAFQRLVELTCKQLTTNLYNFIAKVQEAQQESANAKGILNIIKRENKCLPDLIYHIEDYEKCLIQLTKLTKLNLLRYAKRSTARDFRIFGKENAPNNEPGNVKTTAAENEVQEGSQDNEDSGSENILSPVFNGPLVVEESESEGENGGAEPICKRVKRGQIVQESDDD